jgi:GH43 family beta-xylosidase
MIGNNGFVWTFDKDASNDAQREIKIRKGRMVRGIWAPEIHYINSNFFITYSVSGVIPIGTGTLKNAFPIDFEGNRRFEDFDTTTKMIDLGYQKYIDGKY